LHFRNIQMTNNIQDPWLNKIINYELKNNDQTRTCPVCAYIGNLPSDTNCRICKQKLTNQKLFQNKITKKSLPEKDKRKIVRETRIKSTRQEKLEKFRRRLVKSSSKIYVAIINCKEQLLALWLSCQLKTRKIITLAFGTFLTLLILAFGLNSILTEHTPNHEVSQTKRENPAIPQTDKKLDEDTPLPQSTWQTVSMAKGLFSYAGSPFGDHLVSKEFVKAIESAHPNLKWRNTKSINGNDNSSTSIKRLIDGDLTIAFNSRALNDLEIKRAGLRGITLRQTPIAIDGLVFFANKNISIPANLNLEQIEKIYRGKIKNWNQINLQAGNIPIAPIFQNFEDLNVLGLDLSEVSPLIQHIPNYDQLIRKVISTPGGFSFISASLIPEQKSIKVFNLADSNSSKYVPAFIKGSPNLNAFRSGNYPLTRKIFVAHKEGDAWEQNAGEAYVSFLNTQGQKLIEQSGFVPLRQF
jgi:phosphate transport system substrate-binding protein